MCVRVCVRACSAEAKAAAEAAEAERAAKFVAEAEARAAAEQLARAEATLAIERNLTRQVRGVCVSVSVSVYESLSVPWVWAHRGGMRAAFGPMSWMSQFS